MTDYLTTLFYLNKHCVSLPSPRKDNLREGGFIWVQDSGHFSPSFHRSQQAEREWEGKGRKRERERESKRERDGGERVYSKALSLFLPFIPFWFLPVGPWHPRSRRALPLPWILARNAQRYAFLISRHFSLCYNWSSRLATTGMS